MRVFATLFIFLASLPAFAQTGDSDSKMEFILEGGSILPDQIDGVEEILSMYSLGVGLHSNEKSFLLTYSGASSDESVKIHDFGLGVRKDLPLGGFAAMVGGGLDVVALSRPDFDGTTYFMGAHVSGGLMALISKGLYFRMNMKFNANPGVMMQLAFGFLYRPSEDI